MIVGNKMDLCFESKSSNRMIDQIVLDIGKLADNLEVNQFLISAKTMDGIERLFQTVTSMILKDYSRKQYRSVHVSLDGQHRIDALTNDPNEKSWFLLPNDDLSTFHIATNETSCCVRSCDSIEIVANPRIRHHKDNSTRNCSNSINRFDYKRSASSHLDLLTMFLRKFLCF